MKFLSVILFALLLMNCDPYSIMDADIRNSTSQNLTLYSFRTDSSYNQSFRIDAGEKIRFQEGMSSTGSFHEPYLEDADSLVLKNDADEVLRVYKPDDTGKNIYNIKDHWYFEERKKRIYYYEYVIDQSDFE